MVIASQGMNSKAITVFFMDCHVNAWVFFIVDGALWRRINTGQGTNNNRLLAVTTISYEFCEGELKCNLYWMFEQSQ